jgi:hypothetical protein
MKNIHRVPSAIEGLEYKQDQYGLQTQQSRKVSLPHLTPLMGSFVLVTHRALFLVYQDINISGNPSLYPTAFSRLLTVTSSIE